MALQILKLFRPVNLLIIAMTQFLLRHCIISGYFGLDGSKPALSNSEFFLLTFSTLLIAAGGYVINDYYDREKDLINKPGKMIIGKYISENQALWIYALTTTAGILTGYYLAAQVDYSILGFIFIAIALMLWFYTVRYQRTILWGNIVIGFLAAMVILIVWLFEFFALRSEPMVYAAVMKKFGLISSLVAAYASFAFLISLVREIIKDCEDIEGDSKNEYKTLPVAQGKRTAVFIAAAVVLICMLLLGFAQYWLLIKGYGLIFWYLMIAVQPILAYLIYLTFRAREKEDFRFAGNTAKLAMVAGILSMQLFCISL